MFGHKHFPIPRQLSDKGQILLGGVGVNKEHKLSVSQPDSSNQPKKSVLSPLQHPAFIGDSLGAVTSRMYLPSSRFLTLGKLHFKDSGQSSSYRFNFITNNS